MFLASQGIVQEPYPGEAYQGRQLEYDRAEHSEGRPGESEEMRHRRSKPHSDLSLVAEH